MHKFLKFIFGIKLHMFRTVPLSIIRSFSLYTQQWCMSYRFADSWIRTELQFRPDSARKLSANLYDICHCCVYSKKTPDVQRNCQKHVELYSKNKFEKLVHLVGFIIRIQKKKYVFCVDLYCVCISVVLNYLACCAVSRDFVL